MCTLSAPSLQPNRACSTRGFTLLELLVTLSIAAILLAVAIPSYRGVVQRNAMAAAVNDLVGDLNYARSEAVTRGQMVLVCKSANQTACTTNGGWNQGWIVYAPAPNSTAVTQNNRLRVKSSLETQIQISGNANVANVIGFDANGFARDAGGVTNGTLEARAGNGVQGTDIVISTSGRVRSEPATAGGE